MPSAPPRPCLGNGGRCGVLVKGGGRCAAHRRLSAAARGYDRAWAAVARQWLKAYPWCGQRLGGEVSGEHSSCAQRGLSVPARVVDHIQPIRDGGDRLDLRNLQSLCVSCNTRKG
jgi:5-methylcytosine-specific restriction enzyme A